MNLCSGLARAATGLLWCSITVFGARPASAGHGPVKAPPALNATSPHHLAGTPLPSAPHHVASTTLPLPPHAGTFNTTSANHPQAGIPLTAQPLLAQGKSSGGAHHDTHNKTISEVQISSKTERLETFQKTQHKHSNKHGHGQRHGLKHKVGHKEGKAPGIIVYGAVAPTYIPKIGIANVTTATALPPLPPTLNPIEDYQPADTAIGDYILKQFVTPPTVTPPPLQSAINAAFACPLLLLPGRLWVETSTGCDASRHGSWWDASGGALLNWNESCVAFPDAVNADMKYTLPPRGDLMGTSVTHLNMKDDIVEIFDCSAGAMYTFTEKVYKRANSVDNFVCEKYEICDYQLYFQYFIHSATGALMASTAYLDYFAREITLLDPAVIPIATLKRRGNWSPKDKCPEYRKQWTVTFGGSASALTAPPNRWIVAAFTTILSLREEDRDKAGFIQPSACQKYSFTYLAASILISLAVVIALSVLFWLFCKQRIQVFLFQIEDLIFPRTMYKASKFDP